MRPVKILMALFLLATGLMSNIKPELHIKNREYVDRVEHMRGLMEAGFFDVGRYRTAEELKVVMSLVQTRTYANLFWKGKKPTFSVKDFHAWEKEYNDYRSSLKQKVRIIKAPMLFMGAEPTKSQWLAAIGNPSFTSQDSTKIASKVTITHKEFSSDFFSRVKWLVSDAGVDTVIIRECYFKGSPDRAVDFFGNTVVYFEYNYVEDCGSGYKNSTASGHQYIRYNIFKNMLGPSQPQNRGQSVQFIACTGGGSQVRGNYTWNDASDTNDPEDVINLFSNTGGSSGNPFLVDSNYIQASGWSSTSGGGINLADAGGSWSEANDNVCIYPGQYGVGQGRGSNNYFRRNIVFQTRVDLGGGTGSNVGLVIWNSDGTGYNNCGSNHAYDNRIYYIKHDNSSNPYYIPVNPTGGCTSSSGPCCSSIDSTGNIFNDVTLTEDEAPPDPSVWWRSELQTIQSTIRSFRQISTP